MNIVYLAGKMTGLTKEQMNWWRDIATVELKKTGFAVLNPARIRFSKKLTAREIVDSNKFQIRQSDVILAELDHTAPSLGTIGEIVFAREHGMPVIAWGRGECLKHPWVSEHITIRFYDLDDAIMYIIDNYSINKRCCGGHTNG